MYPVAQVRVEDVQLMLYPTDMSLFARANFCCGVTKSVLLSHGRNQLSTHYTHMSRLYARPGQVVRRGEVIGQVGSTGKVTSSHLHYEVRFRGTAVNPYKYLKNAGSETATFQLAD